MGSTFNRDHIKTHKSLHLGEQIGHNICQKYLVLRWFKKVLVVILGSSLSRRMSWRLFWRWAWRFRGAPIAAGRRRQEEEEGRWMPYILPVAPLAPSKEGPLEEGPLKELQNP